MIFCVCFWYCCKNWLSVLSSFAFWLTRRWSSPLQKPKPPRKAGLDDTVFWKKVARQYTATEQAKLEAAKKTDKMEDMYVL